MDRTLLEIQFRNEMWLDVSWGNQSWKSRLCELTMLVIGADIVNADKETDLLEIWFLSHAEYQNG